VRAGAVFGADGRQAPGLQRQAAEVLPLKRCGERNLPSSRARLQLERVHRWKDGGGSTDLRSGCRWNTAL